MTLRLNRAAGSPQWYGNWPRPGRPPFMASDAYRVLLTEMRRYVHEEVAGRAFLISGYRGAGKTTLVQRVVDDLGDELFRKNNRRDTTEIKPNQVKSALYRLGHAFRFFNRGGERLFTENDFSGFSSGDRNRRMQRVWDGDIDCVNVFSCDDFLPVGFNLAPAPLRGSRLQLCPIAPADHLAYNFVRRVEEMPDLAKGIRMYLADEAGPDHANVQFLPGHSHPHAIFA